MTPDAANGTVNSSHSHHLKLAALLRECANYVERNEFHPDMYQAVGLLHAYTGQHSSAEERQVTTSPKSTSMDPIHVMSSLGKGLKKGLGLEPHSTARINPGAAQATSHKNAERVKADLGDLAAKAERGHRSTENDWCDEHFCLGCACKAHKNAAPLQTVSSTASSTQEESVRSHSPGRDTSRVNVPVTPSTARPAKPSFQRPVNPDSILIANGWIQQQRRSKMRVVWKDVLASLVEGRKPGEETTLWIQRETTNSYTGKPELEALHQIPMKWLLGVEYLGYSTDHKFALKVYNVPEDFLFRCADEESAQNWVLTLRSVREITMKDQKVNKPTKSEVEEWGEANVPPAEQIEAHKPSVEPSSHRMTVSELRAIAHGAGINTAGMERQELEAAVSKIAGAAQSDTAKEKQRHEEELRRKQEMEAELRMRQEMEAELRRRQEMEEELRRRQEKEEELRKLQEMEAEQRRREAVAEEEKRRKEQMEEAEQRRRMAEENERRRKAAEEEERRRRLEEEQQRRREEEQRRRQLAEEEQRRRKLAEEDERRRQQAREELLRRKQEEEAQRARQMAEEDMRRRKLAEEEQRKRAAEQQAAEQRRRQEEAQRQQWQQQQQRQQQQQQQWQYQQQQQQQKPQNWQQRQPPQQHWQQQQPNQQQPFYGAPGAGARRAASPPGQPPPPPQHGQAPPPQRPGQGPPPPRPGQAPPPPRPGQGAPTSPINVKYAKMAAQDDGNGQAAITAIKHNILVHWALQPPMLQMLRPIDVLISTIHTVFPPVFGVAGHDYFSTWQAVKREDLIGAGNYPVEEKLKKGVRKLRFFLHPDKLPRDLSDEQKFMCKMLWDITSDAWDEFEKHKEELDWIRN